MDLQLNILDRLKAPLTPSIAVTSESISLSDVSGDSITTSLLANENYTLSFPADASAGTSLVTVSFPEDATLDFTTTINQLSSGFTRNITTTTAITTINLSVLSVASTSYAQTVAIQRSIRTTLDDGTTVQTFTGINIVNATLEDDSDVTLTIEFPGHYTYINTFRVYDNNETISVALIGIITNPNDPDYRRPYPHFFYILEPCSFNIHVYNGQSSPLGTISYIEESEDNTFSSGTANAILNTCVPDVASISQRIIVREMANCGGTSSILFDERYTINGITTTEYRPNVVLNIDLGCCENIDTEIVAFPSEINMFNTGIHQCDLTGIATALTYTITAPDGAESTLATYTGTQVNAGVLANLGFTYTPTSLGTYTLTIEVTNCCTTTTLTQTFDVCNSWTVTNSECNKINIVNLSTVNPITYTIRELTNNETFEIIEISEVEQENITLGAGSTIELDLQVDNLYTITVVDNNPSTMDREYIFLLDCNIKTCKKALLRDFLCGVDDCATVENFNDMVKLVQFKALEEIIYQKWDVWKQQQTIFDTFSINNIMEDVITLSKAIESINKICSTCGVVNECAVDKRCVCNVRGTNFGMFLTSNNPNVIVGTKGTGCGCS